MEQKHQLMQAVIASEYPRVRSVLSKLTQHQGRMVVAGEAGNEIDTVALTRGIKPHLALVDHRLPYFQGLDGNPLSRIYGFSAARAIAEDMPGTTAILVTNADSEMRLAEVLDTGAIPYLKMRDMAGIMLIPLRQLVESAVSSKVVFAELAIHHPDAVDVPSRTTIREKVARISGLLRMSGTISVGAGFGLLLTVVFAPAGAILLAVGAVGLMVGLSGMRVSRFGAKR